MMRNYGESIETVTFTAGGGAASVYPAVMTIPHLARILDVDVEVSAD